MPFGTHKLVGRQAVEGLESLGVVVGEEKGLQMVIELGGCLVMIELDGGVFDGAVHALDLAVGPGMGHQGAAMLDVVLIAELVERMGG